MNDYKEYGIFYGQTLFENVGEQKPLIDKFLYYGDRMVLAAKPKTGKTVLILQLMCALTTGKPFLNTYKVDKPCNVLYIQAEGSRGEFKENLANMMKELDCDTARIYHINKRGLGLQRKADMDILRKLAAKPGVKYDVIIFDPLYKLLHGGDLNSNKDAIAWTNHVDEFIGDYGATGIIIHHDTEKEYIDKNGNKHRPSAQTLFGSSFWSGFVTHTYKLYKHQGIHRLEIGIQRSGNMIKEQQMKMITPQKDHKGRLFFTTNIDEKEYSSAHLTLENELKKKGRIICPDIYEDLGISEANFFRIAKIMKENGVVVSEKDENNKTWYVWKE